MKICGDHLINICENDTISDNHIFGVVSSETTSFVRNTSPKWYEPQSKSRDQNQQMSPNDVICKEYKPKMVRTTKQKYECGAK